MFLRLLFFLAFLASLSHGQQTQACDYSEIQSLPFCAEPCRPGPFCVVGVLGQSASVYSLSWDAMNMSYRCVAAYSCADWFNVPSSSSGGDNALDGSSSDILSYTITAACFLFSFLIGFSSGSRL